ncbi:efflux RND transporter periplasmic adaptor subunit [Flavihumibacter sp. CACIAM 22H1]|uniref:efflux RND transporter periplasmic adaptor subunit n=1 Tax=Flavihumibacter sp. CACIAM 22H1 TaxID=1812911 RepID=UPI0007A91596|nr:efflux RND transporter periplasmic adaptor subunit [Flavihumibacter sp. CACIAM 22H1]KYP13591.1 MAG: efflux transporter periplasmic adaptor subunit [Flavihumibacter sp. CACIAM 22H1]
MKWIIGMASWLVLAACGSQEPKTNEKQATKEQSVVELDTAQLQLAGIDTGWAVKEKVSSKLTVNGVVDVPPQNIVSVSFPLGGYLKSTRLLPGMRVRKGEVIGMIEDQGLVQLQQDYLVTKAKLNYLKQDFERQQLLNENKVNADKVLQQVSTDYQSQQVLLKGYSEKLRLVGIEPDQLTESSLSRSVALRSPINGYVSKVNVNIGKYVNPTDVLFELINPDDMHGALTVFEKDISKLRLGQKVSMEFVDEPGVTYPGDIIIFSRNVDENRAGAVHCHFDKMPDHLMPGMFLNATIFLDDRTALTVPEEAVVRFSGKQYVFQMLSANRFEMVEVAVESAGKGRLAIASNETDLATQPLVVKNAYAVLGKLKNTADEE